MKRYAPWLAVATLAAALSVARADYPSLSYGRSFLTASQMEARSDGIDQVIVTLTLVDENGWRMVGVPSSQIHFKIKGEGAVIQRVIGPSDSFGKVHAVITSRTPGWIRVYAEVAGRDVDDSVRFQFDNRT